MRLIDEHGDWLYPEDYTHSLSEMGVITKIWEYAEPITIRGVRLLVLQHTSSERKNIGSLSWLVGQWHDDADEDMLPEFRYMKKRFFILFEMCISPYDHEWPSDRDYYRSKTFHGRKNERITELAALMLQRVSQTYLLISDAWQNFGGSYTIPPVLEKHHVIVDVLDIKNREVLATEVDLLTARPFPESWVQCGYDLRFLLSSVIL